MHLAHEGQGKKCAECELFCEEGNETKQALDLIDQHGDDILDQWVIVGDRLRQLRDMNPGHGRASSFSAAVKRHGIDLTANQISAAQWWAALSREWRDKLHVEFPEALAPKWLQDLCRENYPQMARTGKIGKSPSRGNEKKTRSKVKPASLEILPEPEPDAPKPLSAKRKREIAEEEHREELRRRRERRERDEARRVSEDNRPRVLQTPVIMFGVQMWPLDERERTRLGYYDYDQLFFAVHHFMAWKTMLRDTEDHDDRAEWLRVRLKHLHLFIDRRLRGEGQTEMRRFLDVMRKLADLYAANPAGECRLPFDACTR